MVCSECPLASPTTSNWSLVLAAHRPRTGDMSASTGVRCLNSDAATRSTPTCVCGGLGLSLCGSCRRAIYCSRACQTADWQRHSARCRETAAAVGSADAHKDDEQAAKKKRTIQHAKRTVASKREEDPKTVPPAAAAAATAVPTITPSPSPPSLSGISSSSSPPSSASPPSTSPASSAAPRVTVGPTEVRQLPSGGLLLTTKEFIQLQKKKEQQATASTAVASDTLKLAPTAVPTSFDCCSYCSAPGTARCSKCKRACFCSRDCQSVDWKQHKSLCTAPPRHVAPPKDAPSIRDSRLPPAVWARVFSFLSHYQSSLASCVNHAWRNATLLPDAASHGLLTIFDVTDSRWRQMNPHARANLRSVRWCTIFSKMVTCCGRPPPTFARATTFQLQVDPDCAYHTPTEKNAWDQWIASHAGIEHLNVITPHLTPALLPAVVSEPLLNAVCGPNTRLHTFRVVFFDSTLGDQSLIDFHRLSACPTLRFLCITRHEVSAATPTFHLDSILKTRGPIFTNLRQLGIQSHLPMNQTPMLARFGVHMPALVELTLCLELTGRGLTANQLPQWRKKLFEYLQKGLHAMRRTLRDAQIFFLKPQEVDTDATFVWMQPISGAEMAMIASAAPQLHVFAFNIPAPSSQAIWSLDAVRCVARSMKDLRKLVVQVQSKPSADLFDIMSLPHLDRLTLGYSAGPTDAEVIATTTKPPAKYAPATTHLSRLTLSDVNILSGSIPLLRHLPTISYLELDGTVFMPMSVLLEFAQHRPLFLREPTGKWQHMLATDVMDVENDFFDAFPQLHVVDLRYFPHGKWCAQHQAAVHAAKQPASQWSNSRVRHLRWTGLRLTHVQSFTGTHIPLLPGGTWYWDGGWKDVVGLHHHRLYCLDPSQTSLKRTLAAIFKERDITSNTVARGLH